MASLIEFTQIITAPNLIEYNSNKEFIGRRFDSGGTMEGLFTTTYDDDNLKITLTKTIADYTVG